MELSIREHTIRIQIIAIQGRLDAFTVGDLRVQQQQLLDVDHRYFVVDLQQTTFMDSAGMSALVALLKRARAAGGDVVLVKPIDPSAQRILSLTRFDQVFKAAESVEAAFKLF